MKKYLLFILTFLCLSFSAQAAENIDVNLKGKGTEITVNGTATANSKVSVFISKTDYATDYKDIVFVDEIICDNNGDFTVEFNMPDKLEPTYDATATYTVYVASNGRERAVKEFEYVSLKRQNDLLTLVNEAKSGDAIKAMLLNNSNKNAFESMGINISGYKGYTKLQKDVADIIFKAIPYSSISAFEEKYNDAFATTLINNSADFNELSQELKNGGYISFVVDGEDISKNDDVFKFALEYVIKNKTYNSLSDVEKTMKDSVLVYKLKNANKVSLTDIVKQYADYMGIKNHSKYASYVNSTSMQITVNENTILALPKGGADTIAEFVNKFETQLESYKAPTQGGSGGGSGSSGGGSSSSSEIASSTNTNVNNNASNNGTDDGTSILPATGKNTFSDMNGYEWAKEAVEYLYEAGIVHGVSENEFNPERNITREEFTKMIVDFVGIDEVGEISFEDVEKNSWYYDYVSKAYSKGIISGVSDNFFGTGAYITREDATVILARCLELFEVSMENVRDDVRLSDENEIADYAKDRVINMYKKGVINGISDGVFAPKASVTRAQAAKMIYELCKVRGDVI